MTQINLDPNSLKVKILTGQLDGISYTYRDQIEKTSIITDKQTMSEEDYMNEYSPFRNPKRRLTIEQIKQRTLEAYEYHLVFEADRKAKLRAKYPLTN
jgi:hypothetical protein